MEVSPIKPNNKKLSIANNSDGQLSIISVICRICYDNEKDEPLIAPCHCKGTVAFVHRTCLERWLAESNTTTCELCHVVFKTERLLKYTSKQAIWRWLCTNLTTNNNNNHGVRGDLIACTIITPLAILVTYVCLLSSDYYNQRKFITAPSARWTSISLLIMIAIMLIGYYVWVYSVIRYHSKMWFNWWQRECVVRYISPTSYEIAIYDSDGGGGGGGGGNGAINPYNTPYSEQSSSSTSSIILNIINDDILENTMNTSENLHIVKETSI